MERQLMPRRRLMIFGDDSGPSRRVGTQSDWIGAEQAAETDWCAAIAKLAQAQAALAQSGSSSGAEFQRLAGRNPAP